MLRHRTDDPFADPDLPDEVARGWSASDVDPSEYVDDDWIAANTTPGKAPRRPRTSAGRRRRRRAGLNRDLMRRIAARTGYPYVESWSSHSKGAMRGVWGALCHHTGTAWNVAGDYPTLRVVRDGRPGLVNSLSAFGLGRSGTIYLISDKVSWHAGEGEYNGLRDGNGYLAGIEAESDGGAGHWTTQQVDCYPRLVAAILVEVQQGERYTTRHASFALPRGRKTDFAGWPGGPPAFWAKVREYLAHPELIDRNHGEGFLMSLSDAEQRELLDTMRTVADQLSGPGWRKGTWGWPPWRRGRTAQQDATVVDFLRSIDRQVNSSVDLTGRPMGPEDDHLGHQLSTRAEVAQVIASLDKLTAKLDDVIAKLPT
jgi:hypothetical protein